MVAFVDLDISREITSALLVEAGTPRNFVCILYELPPPVPLSPAARDTPITASSADGDGFRGCKLTCTQIDMKSYYSAHR